MDALKGWLLFFASGGVAGAVLAIVGGPGLEEWVHDPPLWFHVVAVCGWICLAVVLVHWLWERWTR